MPEFTARAGTSQQQVNDCLAKVESHAPGFEGFLLALSDRLTGKGGRDVTLQDGRQSLELVSAIYYAIRNSATVELPLSHAHPLYDGWQPTED